MTCLSSRRRFFYLADIRIPSEKAHVLQIFKNCEAFSRQGMAVELWHPQRRRARPLGGIEDVFDYYQVEPCFSLRQIHCPDIRCEACPAPMEKLGYVAHSLAFAAAISRHLHREDADILYTRDRFVASVLALKRMPFFFELHTLRASSFGLRWLKYLVRAACGTIVTTHLLAEDVIALGCDAQRTLVAPDGVDGRSLDQGVEQRVALAQLGLPLRPPIAAYTGHLYRWKGSETLMACAERTPDVGFLIVGGTENDLNRMRSRIRTKALSNVYLAGHVPPSHVGLYLAAADVLLLPNTNEHRLSVKDTSPMKAFEYMASGKPVVASDLPSLREIFHHEVNALLVPPGDQEGFRSAIKRLLDHPELAEKLAESARSTVRKYTWENRARRILDFASRLAHSGELD
jgi:glycosyltransferase involved in cell wall biosynthesis